MLSPYRKSSWTFDKKKKITLVGPPYPGDRGWEKPSYLKIEAINWRSVICFDRIGIKCDWLRSIYKKMKELKWLGTDGGEKWESKSEISWVTGDIFSFYSSQVWFGRKVIII